MVLEAILVFWEVGFMDIVGVTGAVLKVSIGSITVMVESILVSMVLALALAPALAPAVVSVLELAVALIVAMSVKVLMVKVITARMSIVRVGVVVNVIVVVIGRKKVVFATVMLAAMVGMSCGKVIATNVGN